MDAVRYELLQEKASTFARLGLRLEEALAELSALDAEGQGPLPEALAGRRDELLAAAAEALWYYVVTREAAGLRDTEEVLDLLRVPREVRVRMGVRRRGP